MYVYIIIRLWINWPRDRYASVPVTLHLHLAECSGPIRFGVQRSHSFFSFVGDPVMRINVRNEIGKGVFHLKDLPQISDFVVKKLKSFVHRKIVHPNCHKFRLIWPRHWWPEGTEDCFMDAAATASQQPNNSAAAAQKHSEEPNSAVEPDGKISTGSSPDSCCPSPSDNAAAVTSGPDSSTSINQVPNTSSSSYESMKHTVSTWLHKGKDRRQQQQQYRGSLRGGAMNSSSSSTGDKALEPADYNTQSAMATDTTPRRRKSASEKVKSLLHSYADPVKQQPRGVGIYRTLPSSASSSVRNNDGSETAAVTSDGQEHGQRRVSALSPPTAGGSSLQDSAAWDMAVKGICMKYLELQGAGPGRDETSHGGFFLVRSAPPDCSSSSSSSSSLMTTKSVFVLPAMPDSVRRSAERTLPLLRAEESMSAHAHTHLWSDYSRGSEDDSRLIYQPDFTSGRKVSRRHSFDMRRDVPSSADRRITILLLRSTTLSDLRPEVCEAMFRLHVVGSRYAIAEATSDSSSSSSEEYDSGSSREAVSLDSRHAINQFMDCTAVSSDEHSVDQLSRNSCTTPRPVQSKIAIVKSKLANFKAKHIRSSSESSNDTTGTAEGKLSINTTMTEDHEKNAGGGGGAMRYLSAMFRSSSTPGK